MQTYRWGNHKEGRKIMNHHGIIRHLWQNILNNWKLGVTSLPNPLSFTVCTWDVPLDSNSCHQSVLTYPLSHKDAWQVRFKYKTQPGKLKSYTGQWNELLHSPYWFLEQAQMDCIDFCQIVLLKLLLKTKHVLAHKLSSEPWASSIPVCVSQGPGSKRCLQMLTLSGRIELLLSTAAAKHCATSLRPWIY